MCFASEVELISPLSGHCIDHSITAITGFSADESNGNIIAAPFDTFDVADVFGNDRLEYADEPNRRFVAAARILPFASDLIEVRSVVPLIEEQQLVTAAETDTSAKRHVLLLLVQCIGSDVMSLIECDQMTVLDDVNGVGGVVVWRRQFAHGRQRVLVDLSVDDRQYERRLRQRLMNGLTVTQLSALSVRIAV